MSKSYLTTTYFPLVVLTSGQKKLILSVIKKYLPRAKVYIFGSRVTGKAKKFSDVDIAVDNLQKISFDLLVKIKDELDPKIPCLIDLVDLSAVSKLIKINIKGCFLR